MITTTAPVVSETRFSRVLNMLDQREAGDKSVTGGCDIPTTRLKTSESFFEDCFADKRRRGV